jgi:hypothetical protein
MVFQGEVGCYHSRLTSSLHNILRNVVRVFLMLTADSVSDFDSKRDLGASSGVS